MNIFLMFSYKSLTSGAEILRINSLMIIKPFVTGVKNKRFPIVPNLYTTKYREPRGT